MSFSFPYNLHVPHRPRESLEQFQERVRRLEKPYLTSPMYSRAGWPALGLGVLLWLIEIILPGSQLLSAFIGLVLIGAGVGAIIMSLISAHSEGVEESERARLIRERDSLSRCLYLEGKVPDGKGNVGRCRLYEFDMVDYPYCIYCKEYTASEGEPEV